MLTNMDRPIGYMIGNSLEIIETLQCLRGEGPASTRELTVQEGERKQMICLVQSHSIK